MTMIGLHERFLAAATVGLLASASVGFTLPPVVYADRETSTNVALCVTEGAGRFDFAMSCLATPTNNVQAAFGVDRDGDGVLALDETDCVFGWDCGAWFVQEGAVGARHLAATASTNAVQTFACALRFNAAGVRQFAATCDGTAVSWEGDEALPPRLRRGAWNLVRLTGRGLDVQDESFAVAIRPDAIAIRFR